MKVFICEWVEKKNNIKEKADVSLIAEAVAGAKEAAEAYDTILAMELLSPHKNFAYNDVVDKLLEDVIFCLEVFDCDSAIENIIKLEEELK